MFHVITACFVGKFGLADYSLSLARSLSRFSRSEVVTSQDFQYPDVPFDGEITRIFRRSRRYPIDVIRFLLYIIKEKPGAVIFQSCLKVAFIDAILVHALRVFGLRVFVTVHDILPHYPKPWSRLEYEFFYKSFSGLIAHSSQAKKSLDEFGVTAPILVVPHGVYDIYRLSGITKNRARERIGGLLEDDFIALFFGRIDERKGVEALVDIIVDQGLPAKTKILFAGINGVSSGNSSLSKKLQNALNSRNCVAHVREISFVEVETFFSASDVVLLPYKEGTTSGVLKLAIAFERPVIATDVGDLPSNVLPGTGLIISKHRVFEDLPSAIESIRVNYSDYELACKGVAEDYSWKSIGEKYFDFISRT
ncbi:MAG: glycosyltransferase [Gammaproteobacteria bacterium]|nr:glycosyltransferase [Gammaproteobacteria bacterium]MBU0773315.1 glycosyltransferase [Gammaproteobacteria bacterium]MBU0854707.1 glycosyltransferase [Gammaproteobacteria bacterium]MBU1846717.1 glycosyltransferase [Gammaproteobacteria bacterium]